MWKFSVTRRGDKPEKQNARLIWSFSDIWNELEAAFGRAINLLTE
jgi:hypothetical protein